MTQNYGVSFAAKLITQGQYDEAVASATKEHDRDPADPEPLLDRALAYVELDRHADAVADLERALVLDREAQMLEAEVVDDSLFSSLLGDARQIAARDVEAAVRRLEHYRAVLPAGRHLSDVEVWTRRLRGEGRNDVIVKERESS